MIKKAKLKITSTTQNATTVSTHSVSAPSSRYFGTPERSMATQNTAAVQWPRAWSDYFGAPFLWFVSFGEAKEMNNSRRTLALIILPHPKKDGIIMKTPERPAPPERSRATQNTAAVRWPCGWSDYFGGPFLWFVSFGQAKEMNARAGQETWDL